jgi:hypothetical protein
MKANFFISSLIIVLFTLTANSQITKGNWMVGGDVYYNYADYGSNDSSWAISLKPNVSYYIIDKLAIGVIPKIGIKKGYDNLVYGFGISSRYYFLKPKKMFNFFIEPKIDMSYSKNNHDIITKNYGYGIKIGESVFLNQSVALEFFVDYDNRYNTYKGIKGNNIQNINIGFGLQIYLEKDK